ncbi:MAG: hypothetical protein V3U37_04400 [Nitrospinaceae bacterium]
MAKFYGEKYFSELGIEYNQELNLFKHGNCRQCLQTGYAGKTALHEIWVGTANLRKLIVDKASAADIREQAVKDGMIGMNQDGVYKIFKGDCDLKQIKAAGISEPG